MFITKPTATLLPTYVLVADISNYLSASVGSSSLSHRKIYPSRSASYPRSLTFSHQLWATCPALCSAAVQRILLLSMTNIKAYDLPYQLQGNPALLGHC